MKNDITFIEPGDRFAAFKLADVALAASGTVTTELAISRTPMVIAYKMDAFTALWFRQIMTTEYVTILNIAAKREVIPEFIQKDCDAELILPALEKLITDEKTRNAQLQAFDKLLDDLEIEGAPAARKAADAIVKIMNG